MDAAIKELVDKGEMLPLMEEFYTIQGEGFHKGTAAYFIRVGGCDVGCHWCDVKESWNAELHPPTHITNIIDALDGTSATTTVVASGSFSGSLTGNATSATTATTATSVI